ncbi:MAG TPA: cell division ATP-binding protein FtsE [Rhizobiales bacterium]|nr:cell division ATP-binding protein FtsE [Hyphomicrobiales bacterium]
MSSNAPVVVMENVGLRYGRGKEVLRDINLTLHAGSFQFLTGPSGAGKTSLMRLLLLSMKPTRGLVSIFGRDTATLRPGELPRLRRRVGVVFQDFRLLDHLTTFENVALPLRVSGQRMKNYRDNVHELLAWVGLADYANAYPPVLSGGEKQRAAIARAVVTRPDLLLADEPTGNVDPELAVRLLGLFGELNKFGTTVVIATHDTNLVSRSKSPVLLLDEGRLSTAS